MPEPFTVPVGAAETVSALAYTGAGTGGPEAAIILAPGAGAPQTHPFLTGFAHGLASRGIGVVTFNFPYMERGRRAPDPRARLEACYGAVIELVRKREVAGLRLLAGGKSMGGRIASQVVAGAAQAGSSPTVDGLVFLGYPLHPPGRPDKLRAAHLPSIPVPMLFVQGSRDTFGTPDELRPVLTACPRAELHVVEGGDHSFRVRGKGTPSPAEVHAVMQDAILDWIGRNP
ncbi:MAG: dienelactone hydrolase [Acidobacteria bacterium]|nr:dienelactone hydrolase [Acidobacteriota bacterium]